MPTPDHNKQTPRTDAAETINYHLAGEFGKTQWVRADFARQLEIQSATQLHELKRAHAVILEMGQTLLDSAYLHDSKLATVRECADMAVRIRTLLHKHQALARPAHTEELADKGEAR